MIHGNQGRNFGVNGAYDAAVFPGPLFAQTCTSLPNSLYLFSGHCLCGQSGTGNYLWQFNAITFQWRFVPAGTFSTNGDPYCYTKTGVEDPRNIPAGRYGGTITSMEETNSVIMWSGWSYTPCKLRIISTS